MSNTLNVLDSTSINNHKILINSKTIFEDNEFKQFKVFNTLFKREIKKRKKDLKNKFTLLNSKDKHILIALI